MSIENREVNVAGGIVLLRPTGYMQWIRKRMVLTILLFFHPFIPCPRSFLLAPSSASNPKRKRTTHPPNLHVHTPSLLPCLSSNPQILPLNQRHILSSYNPRSGHSMAGSLSLCAAHIGGRRLPYHGDLCRILRNSLGVCQLPTVHECWSRVSSTF